MTILSWCKISNNFTSGVMWNISQSCRFNIFNIFSVVLVKNHINILTCVIILQGWTAGSKEVHDIEDILVHAFTRLDEDMSREAIPKDGQDVDMKTLTVAMSGCVAVAAHIEGPHLSVASTGDCTAVVGSLSETDTWVAKKLTNEHNSDNNKEVKRILANHPETEHHHIIKGDRLLGMLAPLRAFGDFKFKWPRSTIEETLGGVLGEHAVPANYKTPPYLTAVPEVTYHRLTPRDKFLILGSDGLWDMMTPMQVLFLMMIEEELRLFDSFEP